MNTYYTDSVEMFKNEHFSASMNTPKELAEQSIVGKNENEIRTDQHIVTHFSLQGQAHASKKGRGGKKKCGEHDAGDKKLSQMR